jgi:hypothetical protein
MFITQNNEKCRNETYFVSKFVNEYKIISNQKRYFYKQIRGY